MWAASSQVRRSTASMWDSATDFAMAVSTPRFYRTGVRLDNVLYIRRADALNASPLLVGPPAVDQEDLAGDEARPVRGKEGHRVGDVLGLPTTYKRHPIPPP